MTWLWVALGSAVGGVGRYWCNAAIETRLGDGFPWGTLAVNVLGSIAIGLVATLNAPDGRLVLAAEARQFLMIGVFGGFTTFSSFSLQSVSLLQDGRLGPAAAYVGASMALCLLGAWGGYGAGLWWNR